MPTYSARALVLKKTKLGETDLIITLFSEVGKQLRAIAKGSRRPGSKLGAHLELYSAVDLLVHTGRSLDVITEVRSWVTNEACRRDIEHSAGAAVIVELLDKVSRDNVIEPRLYPLSLEALRCIGDAEHCGIDLIVAAYIIKATAQLGYRPALLNCAVCGSPVNVVTGTKLAFSFLEGGIQCRLCKDNGYLDTTILMDADRLMWAHTLLQSRFMELEAYCLSEYSELGRSMLDFAQRWLHSHLSIHLKSLDFLISLDT
ncbi:MAG: DNA repair protein RecO [Coriobacteriaceae bacterium]|nr:DNA repair protein RecO [Coriobacteriaceae bacterium]